MTTHARLTDLARRAAADADGVDEAATRYLQAGALAKAEALAPRLSGDALALLHLGRGRPAEALDVPDIAPDTAARALVALGRADEALQVAPAGPGRVLALLATGAPAEAAAAAAAWARRPGHDTYATAEATTLLGRCLVELRDYPRATVAFRTALPLHRAIGSLPGVVACLGGLGLCDLGTGHGLASRGAMSLFQAVTLASELGDDAAEAAWRTHLDHALVVLDRTEQRVAELGRFRAVVRRLGDRAWEASLARDQAGCWAALRDDPRRLACLAEAEALDGPGA